MNRHSQNIYVVVNFTTMLKGDFEKIILAIFISNSHNQNENSTELHMRAQNKMQSNFLPRPHQENNSSQFQTPTESYSERVYSSSGLSSSGMLSSNGMPKPRSGNPTPDTSIFRGTPRVCCLFIPCKTKLFSYLHFNSARRQLTCN